MVQWTAEKDQILLKGIFKFHDIKSSTPLLKYLASEIGEGCTPKAVSHRLNGIRSSGKPVKSNGATSPSGKAASSPRAPKTPKTPRVQKPAGTTPKRTATPSNYGSALESFMNDPELKTPPSGRKGRALPKRPYAESDGDEGEKTPLSVKKVKVENGDDDSGVSSVTVEGDDSELEV